MTVLISTREHADKNAGSLGKKRDGIVYCLDDVKRRQVINLIIMIVVIRVNSQVIAMAITYHRKAAHGGIGSS